MMALDLLFPLCRKKVIRGPNAVDCRRLSHVEVLQFVAGYKTCLDHVGRDGYILSGIFGALGDGANGVADV